MQDNLKGLTKSIDILRASIADTRIDEATRYLLASEIKRAQKVVAAYRKALGEDGS